MDVEITLLPAAVNFWKFTFSIIQLAYVNVLKF